MGVCATREFGAFVAPFQDNITYSYNFEADKELSLHDESLMTKHNGIPISSHPRRSAREGPKWYKVKNYKVDTSPAATRLYIAGRIFIQFMAESSVLSSSKGVNVFAICIRGKPIAQKMEGYPDGAHIFNSGIFFCFYLQNRKSQLYLSPHITMMTEACNEISLCEDLLGPVTMNAFYLDFAIVDDGRNVQLDVIIRTAAGKAFRTCVQEYTMYNSGTKKPSVSVGYSHLSYYTMEASVHLQDFHISEREFKLPPCGKVVDWREGVQLFVGEDSTQIVNDDMLPDRSNHPQFVLDVEEREKMDKTPSGNFSSQPSNEHTTQDLQETAQRTAKFWHHIRFDNQQPTKGPRFDGEFWLTKAPLTRGTYYASSSTLHQAKSR